ncbi:MAG: tRNA lysidine(34) synthetase TilS [Methylotenera sp.]
MASLKKLPASSSKKSLQHQLKVFLADVFLSQNNPNPKLLLAFSGGLDSAALLHLLVEINKTIPFQLRALHVHHGLSPNADTWTTFCKDTCANLNIPIAISKVNINKNSGLGLEATAREARYKALLESESDFILLAHHQNDQAETLLLQLARGAGVKGLAGMGIVNNKLLRPLLDVPRSALVAYAKQHNLTWIEDESNLDTKFDRNFMRHEILPKLEKQYPAIRQTISRAAQHMAEADVLLDELAEIDVRDCLLNRQQLQLAPLAKISSARVNNALRWWLLQNNCEAPSAAQLQQISQQLLHAKSDANIKIKLSASLVLRRFQGSAYLLKNLQEGDAEYQRSAFSLPWQGEKTIILPDQSRLFFSEKLGQGIAMRHVENGQLNIRYRRGGETLKPEENRPNRSLKSLFQTSQVPPWQRERFPLLFLNDELTMLPNIAVAAALKAKPDELGLYVKWQDN